MPRAVPSPTWQHYAAVATHASLYEATSNVGASVLIVVVVVGRSIVVVVARVCVSYGVIVFMPISGLAFGYASGWGVPFFAWSVPGAPKEKAETPLCECAGRWRRRRR